MHTNTQTRPDIFRDRQTKLRAWRQSNSWLLALMFACVPSAKAAAAAAIDDDENQLVCFGGYDCVWVEVRDGVGGAWL